MEPIAVNRLTVTRELFAEAHDAIFSRRRRKMLLSCGIIFVIFGIALYVVQTRMPVASALSFPALLSGVIVIIWALTLQKSELRRKYKVFQRRNGDASERVISFYNTHLIVETGNTLPVQIDYTDIRDHKLTEHLYLLLCAGHTGVMLAKDGFETGSWQGLLDAVDKAKREALEAAKLLEM